MTVTDWRKFPRSRIFRDVVVAKSLPLLTLGGVSVSVLSVYVVIAFPCLSSVGRTRAESTTVQVGAWVVCYVVPALATRSPQAVTYALDSPGHCLRFGHPHS